MILSDLGFRKKMLIKPQWIVGNYGMQLGNYCTIQNRDNKYKI